MLVQEHNTASRASLHKNVVLLYYSVTVDSSYWVWFIMIFIKHTLLPIYVYGRGVILRAYFHAKAYYCTFSQYRAPPAPIVLGADACMQG